MTQDITALEELKISEEVELVRMSLIIIQKGNIQGIEKVQSQTQSGVRSWVSKRTTTRKKPDEGDSVSTIQFSLFSAFTFALFSPL